MSTIAIIGAGHVGVVYAAGLAELGHVVRVVDVDQSRIRTLANGELWFHEPGLHELTKKGLDAARLSFTADYAEALRLAEFAFVCVPTPAATDGRLDDLFLRAAYSEVRQFGARGLIVVNKSTVPIGMSQAAGGIFAGKGFRIVSNPEFLSEGRALDDFFHPSRVVLGGDDAAALEAVAAIYAPLGVPIVKTTAITAELIKLGSNAFLATKVSFANSLAAIGDGVGAEAQVLLEGVGLDPRIGKAHLRAGLGWGGSCLPKDLGAIEQLAAIHGACPELFAAVAAMNRRQRERLLQLMQNLFGTLAATRVAILGASYKANTDDLRGSPALYLAQELVDQGATVSIYDPAITGGVVERRDQMASFDFERSAFAAAAGADAVIIATDWPEFGALNLADLRKAMKGDILIDGRGLIDLDAADAVGLRLFTLGRTSVVGR